MNRCKATVYRILAMAVMVFSGLLAGPGTAEAGLRGNMEISGGDITLGHLFDNAGNQATTVVRRSPAPGQTIEFSIHRLRALASDFQLPWKSPTFRGPVLVRRLEVQLYPEMVHRAILAELSQLGVRGSWRITLNSIPENIWLPSNAIKPDKFPIHGFMFDPQRGRFSAL